MTPKAAQGRATAPVAPAAPARSPLAAPDVYRRAKLAAPLLVDGYREILRNPGNANGVTDSIDEEVPEQYRDAARSLLDLLKKNPTLKSP